MSTYDCDIQDREFLAKDGTRAYIALVTVVFEREEHEPEHVWIDSNHAEVFPCVWGAWGMPCYAQDALTGEALRTWLDRYHEDLVDVALDAAHAEAERHDEEMAERR